MLVTPLLAACLLVAGSAQDGGDLVDAARAAHGEAGVRAAEFLLAHRPDRDRGLGTDFLLEHLTLALEARERHPWARKVPEALFLNDVLPYAVLDETRERWRPEMLKVAAPLVEDATTAEEAIQALNRGLFNAVGVHYDKGRKKPNASPSESIEQGRATCTGLSILLIDACRAVGIPARAAGVFLWHDDRGNHTWVEAWDGERWRFLGADEYDAQGLDRGWFTSDAARAVAGDLRHAVWASSWAPGPAGASHFPLAWAPESKAVAAVEVTERYREDRSPAAELGQDAGAALSEEAALKLGQELWKRRTLALQAELQDEDEAEAFELDGKRMRVKEVRFGKAPVGKRSLWISMHGGGGAPPEVNDQQWSNQIRLYRPAEGIYVAPRAPTDTWNLWHQAHVDDLLDRLITSYVTRHGVDPNRVYLMGYSAGGDGVYQLAPRMADRFAAAAMMAGHPNDARPEGLRNLPFMIYMGGKDGAYDRNKVAAQWQAKLGALREEDPKGYTHSVTIYPGKGHWMDGEDRSALPWMSEFARDPWPRRVVWVQDDVTHRRFYWLALPEDAEPARGAKVVATVDGRTIAIEAPKQVERLVLRLNDELLDLDRELRVTWNGEQVWSGKPERTRAAIEQSLKERADPTSIATATIEVGVGKR